jgi:hypothetical protein
MSLKINFRETNFKIGKQLQFKYDRTNHVLKSRSCDWGKPLEAREDSARQYEESEEFIISFSPQRGDKTLKNCEDGLSEF